MLGCTSPSPMTMNLSSGSILTLTGCWKCGGVNTLLLALHLPCLASTRVFFTCTLSLFDKLKKDAGCRNLFTFCGLSGMFCSSTSISSSENTTEEPLGFWTCNEKNQIQMIKSSKYTNLGIAVNAMVKNLGYIAIYCIEEFQSSKFEMTFYVLTLTIFHSIPVIDNEYIFKATHLKCIQPH